MLLKVICSRPVLLLVRTLADVAAIFVSADLVDGLPVAGEVIERAKSIPIAGTILYIATVWF